MKHKVEHIIIKKHKISSCGNCKVHFPKLFNYSKQTFKKQSVTYPVYVCFRFGGIWVPGVAASPVIITQFIICTCL